MHTELSSPIHALLKLYEEKNTYNTEVVHINVQLP